MKDKLRICATCHSKYDFCNRCNKDKDKPLWYFTFCSDNCKDIYDVTSKFEDGRIDAYEAKTQLDKLDLSKLNSFGTSYKNSINKIMSFVSIPIEVKDDMEMKNDTEIILEKNIKTTKEIVEEEKVFKKPKNKRVKNGIEE